MKMDRTTLNRKRRQFKELKLVGVSDIAKELEWTNGKVSTYNMRGKFPEPVGIVGGRPVWLRDEITPYLRQLKEEENK